jgi:hypothetical protein
LTSLSLVCVFVCVCVCGRGMAGRAQPFSRHFWGASRPCFEGALLPCMRACFVHARVCVFTRRAALQSTRRQLKAPAANPALRTAAEPVIQRSRQSATTKSTRRQPGASPPNTQQNRTQFATTSPTGRTPLWPSSLRPSPPWAARRSPSLTPPASTPRGESYTRSLAGSVICPQANS